MLGPRALVLEEMRDRGAILDATLSTVKGAVGPEAARWGIELARSTHRMGIALAVGTNNPAAGAVAIFDELEMLVDSVGLTPSEAMPSATLVGAAVLGLQDRLGSVETGKVADLVLYQENPTEEIMNARHPALVIKNGQLVMR